MTKRVLTADDFDIRDVYLCGPMSGYPDFNFPEFRRVANIWVNEGYEVANPAEDVIAPGTRTWEFYMRRAFQMLLSTQAIALLPGWEGSVGARAEVFVALTLKMPVFDALTFEQLPLTEAWTEIVGDEKKEKGTWYLSDRDLDEFFEQSTYESISESLDQQVVASRRQEFDSLAEIYDPPFRNRVEGILDDEYLAPRLYSIDDLLDETAYADAHQAHQRRADKASNIFDMAKGKVYGDRHSDYGDCRIHHKKTANLWNAWLGDRLMPGGDIHPWEVSEFFSMDKGVRLQHGYHKDSYVDKGGYAETGRLNYEHEIALRDPSCVDD